MSLIRYELLLRHTAISYPIEWFNSQVILNVISARAKSSGKFSALPAKIQHPSAYKLRSNCSMALQCIAFFLCSQSLSSSFFLFSFFSPYIFSPILSLPFSLSPSSLSVCVYETFAFSFCFVEPLEYIY